MLARTPSNLAGWTSYLRDTEIPVLAKTALAIDALREDEENVDAQTLAALAIDDPLMTLRVLSHISRKRPSRMVTDVETVGSAVLLIGIPPFFRAFASMQTVESHLGAHPAALAGLRRVVARSHRAAHFALAIAVLRHDADAEVIHEAALLHDFAEMLVWCHAPALLLDIQRRQRDDPALRTATAQREVLNVELCDVEQELMKTWRLPELLTQITDHRRAEHPRVRNVLLATALARHSQNGWNNPALPDDIRAIADLVNLSPEHVRHRLMQLDPRDELEALAAAEPELIFDDGPGGGADSDGDTRA
jgi:HD-like signal output (HDOD) protein